MEGGGGGLENWIIFMDVIYVSFLTTFLMIFMLKANQMFLNDFMITRFKFFHDILNFILILAPGGAFSCA